MVIHGDSQIWTFFESDESLAFLLSQAALVATRGERLERPIKMIGLQVECEQVLAHGLVLKRTQHDAFHPGTCHRNPSA